jgi:hypothetical protein
MFFVFLPYEIPPCVGMTFTFGITGAFGFSLFAFTAKPYTSLPLTLFLPTTYHLPRLTFFSFLRFEIPPCVGMTYTFGFGLLTFAFLQKCFSLPTTYHLQRKTYF